MSYGIQVMGADGTVGLQIDARLPRIIASGYIYLAYLHTDGLYYNPQGGAYAFSTPISTEVANTKELSVNMAYTTNQPDYSLGWHFSAGKINENGQWYAVLNCIGFAGSYYNSTTFYPYYHPAQYVSYTIVAW
jgi:hypothetical protein